MSKGVRAAFGQAEVQAQKEKNKKKIKNHQDLFKENSTSILAEELKAMLSQLRIQVSNLTNQQKALLKNNISYSFETSIRTSKGLLEDIKSALLLDETQNPIEQRVSALERNLLAQYPESIITPEHRRNYVISQVLSRTPVDGVEKYDYFLKNFFTNFVPKNKKQALRKLSRQSLVSVELSGIKDINDTYGHAQCDEMVYDTINEIIQLAKDQNMEKYLPMFASGISSYFMILPSSKYEQSSQLCADILSIDSNFKIGTSHTRLGANLNAAVLDGIMNNKDKTSIDLLKYLFDSASSHNNEKNRKIISASKIRDKSPIIRYISRNLKRITKSLGKDLDSNMINDALNYVLEIEEPLIQSRQPYDNRSPETYKDMIE